MQVASYLLDNDVEFFRELLILFLSEYTQVLELVRAMIAKGDDEHAAKQVHKLRCSAANLGAMQLKTAAAVLEQGLNKLMQNFNLNLRRLQRLIKR